LPTLAQGTKIRFCDVFFVQLRRNTSIANFAPRGRNQFGARQLGVAQSACETPRSTREHAAGGRPTPSRRKANPMTRILLAGALALLASSASFAAEPSTMSRSSGNEALMSAVPRDAVTVTDWYKQDVYDPSNNKIGVIDDVLVDKSGKVEAVIISVGGFLGIDTKNVAEPFTAIHATKKDNKWWLTMNTTKDALKSAPGYKYDQTSTTWVAEKS
jgi:PRC-barrel domain